MAHVSQFSKCVFPILYSSFGANYVTGIWRQRVAMLAELANVKSADETLRAQGVITVLEIGVGPGSNFKFYPDNVRLTLLEPNPFFMKPLMRNLLKYPNIDVDRVLVDDGENMCQVQDNSMDAVVATHVLCSVRDVNAVLKEIHRVLAPGGKYLFMEHGHGKRKWLHWQLQLLATPIWKCLSDGCEITKDTLTDIKRCELFIDVRSNSFPGPIQAPMILKYLMGLNFYGSAQKPNRGQLPKL